MESAMDNFGRQTVLILATAFLIMMLGCKHGEPLKALGLSCDA